MKILSHRGYWKTADEKNSEAAFIRSFTLGFGTETDLRDRNGQIVISHDPPASDSQPITLDRLLDLYKAHEGVENSLPLALNIKADGLQGMLLEAVRRHAVTNFFVFDMSVPDALIYLREGLPAFARQSEYETEPLSFYEQATGIWIDGFHGEWMDEDTVRRHLVADKQVCLVSPDLHRRPHEAFWEMLRQSGLHDDAEEGLMLCTDYPEAARKFFYGAD